MHLSRLFEIVYLLVERQTVTAKELSERFEVSVRTIYRDIECLSEAGIPIYMTRGRGGGISIMPQFILNKLLLTNEEKSEIITSMRALSALRQDDSSSAIGKVSSLFGQSLESDWVEIDFSTWSASDREKTMFIETKKYIFSKNLCRILYRDGLSSKTERTIEPLKLCFRGGSWYLYAYCHKRADYRFFKLSRIMRLEALAERFERNAPKKVFDDIKYNLNMTDICHINSGMLNSNNKEVSNMENYENIKFCQSCAMPMTEELYGTEKDGSLSEDYCKFCYKDGEFIGEITMEEMIEFCVKPMVEHNPEFTSEEQARETMRKVLPTLKRWR